MEDENMIMKFISLPGLLVGVLLLGISSCATAPKPLAPGELRLLSILVPGKENVKLYLPFTVDMSFEADGEPEIRAACFYFADDGPHCFKVTDVNYGSPGTVRSQIHTSNPGAQLLKGYILYIRNGKIQSTNMLSAYFRTIQQ